MVQELANAKHTHPTTSWRALPGKVGGELASCGFNGKAMRRKWGKMSEAQKMPDAATQAAVPAAAATRVSSRLAGRKRKPTLE